MKPRLAGSTVGARSTSSTITWAQTTNILRVGVFEIGASRAFGVTHSIVNRLRGGTGQTFVLTGSGTSRASERTLFTEPRHVILACWTGIDTLIVVEHLIYSVDCFTRQAVVR